MNTRTPWSQARLPEPPQHGAGRLSGSPRARRPEAQNNPLSAPEWVSPPGLRETDTEYPTEPAFPEAIENHIAVPAEEGSFAPTGFREFESVDDGGECPPMERSGGGFVRDAAIRADGSAGTGFAPSEEGVLTIHVTETEEAKPQRIEVKIAGTGSALREGPASY